MDKAAHIAITAVIDFINENQPNFELVHFVLFAAQAMKAFSKALYTLINP
ncbi:MAG: hypothetical protein Q9P44_09000 [Anaerolineae bacterium]|nr:hypothetical protein [Anaerolineae bacterium]